MAGAIGRKNHNDPRQGTVTVSLGPGKILSRNGRTTMILVRGL